MPDLCPICKGSKTVDVAPFGQFGKWDTQPCPRCLNLEDGDWPESSERLTNTAMTREYAEGLAWGTYGLEAAENNAIFGTPLPPIQQTELGKLEDDHLKRILMGGAGASIDDEYREAIIMILKARRGELFIETSARNSIRRRDAIAATKARLNDEVV